VVTSNVYDPQDENVVQQENSPDAMMAVKRSELIFKYRMAVGLTQSELAQQANVTQKTISRIERGDRNVRQTTLKKVYQVLGIPDEELEALKVQLDT